MSSPTPPVPRPGSAARVRLLITVAVAVVLLGLLVALALWWFLGRDGPDGRFTEQGQSLLIDDRSAPEPQQWLESPYGPPADPARPSVQVWPVGPDRALLSPGLIERTSEDGSDEVYLMDLGTGEPIWTAPIGDHCPANDGCAVTVQDLPGTEHVLMTWWVMQDSTPRWRMALLDRTTGAEVSALEGDGHMTMASLPSGNSYLMRYAESHDPSRIPAISRITDDLAEPEWTAQLTMDADSYVPYPREADGVVYLDWNDATVAALRIDDGSPVEGLDVPFVQAGDVRLVESEDRRSVVAQHPDGTEAWQQDLSNANYFTCADRLYRSEVDPNRLLVVDPATGDVEHVNDMPNPISQNTCVGDWIVSLDREVAVLDGPTGRLLWTPGEVEAIKGFGESTVLVEEDGESKRLVARELADGSDRWTVQMPDGGNVALYGHHLVMWRADGSFTVLR